MGFLSRLLGRKPTLPAGAVVKGGPAAHFADSRNWTPVESSNLVAIAYFSDPRNPLLRIRFRQSTYEYEGVPHNVFLGLLQAPSKGKYHHAVIKKGGYRYRKVS